MPVMRTIDSAFKLTTTAATYTNTEAVRIRQLSIYMIHNFGHLKLGVRGSSEDHATLRSATAKNTRVQSIIAGKQLAVRTAIVALVYAQLY